MTTASGYNVEYSLDIDLDESVYEMISLLNDTDVPLTEVRDNCREFNCKAYLFDAAGFRVGYVYPSGDYRLSSDPSY